MRPCATLRLPGGRLVEVGPGDLLGRTPTAAVVIDDPRVSEAHAFVSLRHGELHLLSLRRLIVVDGRPRNDVVLCPGQVIGIADELAVTVTAVATPTEVVALRTPGQPLRHLSQVVSIVDHPPRIVARVELDAHAQLWSIGDAWRLRRRGHPDEAVGPGASFDVDGVSFTLVTVPIGQAGPHATQGAGATAEPLRLVAYYDTVQIHRRNRELATLGGTSARIVSELVACQGPTSWEVLARGVWSDEADTTALRHRWDVALGRLRARLRELDVRDLVRSVGAGQLSLELYDGDEVDDRT
ncbi:MAG: FHA domain-containing protein [Kofleriaceae bacterium]